MAKLRKVKYIWIDDENSRLVFQAEGPGAVLSFSLGAVDQPGGIAGLNDSGRIKVEQVTPFIEEMDHLPAPGEEHLGRSIRVKLPEEGSRTEIYACVVNSQGEYEWIELSEST
ncbi:hypothetical protein LCGC14_0555100 [marine sediment metagenome]|uniref:Uncharacterized protein n=1 Tax=marine sediment metagenome TaxID=412755 RepID=A0A0F9RTT7_9ZZZZ